MPVHLNSIATPSAHLVGPGKLKILNGRLAFSTGKGTPTRLDPKALRSLICYGRVGITDDAFAMLFEHGVEVSWLSPRGSRLRGRLVSSVPSGTNLRVLQHQVLSQPDHQLSLARLVVVEKIKSQKVVARHYQRHGHSLASKKIGILDGAERRAALSKDLEQLRGIEGAATRAWFAVLGQVLGEPWNFSVRVRRPPTDPVNSLLSLGYTFLLNKTIARCEAAGLELQLGALHDYRPGRPSLACDLIEPLRAPVVDRWVIYICKQGMVDLNCFVTAADGGVKLQPDKFGDVLQRWEEFWSKNDSQKKLEKTIQAFIRSVRRLAPVDESGGPDAATTPL